MISALTVLYNDGYINGIRLLPRGTALDKKIYDLFEYSFLDNDFIICADSMSIPKSRFDTRIENNIVSMERLQVFGKPDTWWNGTIKSGVIESQFVAANPLSTDGFYHLLAEQNGTVNGKIVFDTTDGVYKADFGTGKKTFSNADSSTRIKAFLAAATDLTIDVKHVLSSAEIQACSNDKQKATLKFLCVGSYYEGTTEKNAQGWSSARWETSLYDFKKRKFKCESITYSEETGRIVSIVFTEYK